MNSEGQVHLHLIDEWIKSMHMPDIRKIALKMGLKFRNMGKTQLIRLIQRAEGNKACFGTQDTCDCDQLSCLWRADCAKAYFTPAATFKKQ